MQPEHRILRAWLTSASGGIIELDTDWTADLLPLLAPGEKAFRLESLAPADPALYAEEAAYFVDAAGRVVFVLDPADHAGVDFERTAVYVGGDFNGWQEAIGRPEWQLKQGELLGRACWLLAVAADHLLRDPALRFKFVTADARWLALPPDSTNRVQDDQGRANLALLAHRTGRNLFAFTTREPIDPSRTYSVIHLRDGQQSPKIRLRLGKFFHALHSNLPLGALVKKDETIFRLFAPRARTVRVATSEELDPPGGPHVFELEKCLEAGGWRGVWEVRVDRNLDGWFYWYSVSGPQNVFGNFHPNERILDPYALAAAGRGGPGIVLDAARVGKAARGFRTPPWQDLVIAEAHVRDLVAHAPLELTAEERLGFAGLTKWVESPDFYLKKLGVNAVELQPIQEHDNTKRDEYQWGYMTTNWFAPASAYATAPERATQVEEFRELVAAFHRQGMAVILDVVYNHAGEPAHLMFIDKLYYFELGDDGALANWSGCGNDLRCRSAMTKRLIIDSLVHLLETYGVDGFRFDLAELIGAGVLAEIEVALKKTKPDVILIAEPWSFRGHIADVLRPTGFASWNDGYRNFLREYVHGAGAAEKLEYFLKGSPWHFAFWPAQTVNYTESHDDRTWLDQITENGGHNGFRPTLNDVRRTHLMAAVLFASVGIPMISAGQDFLRSKHGVNNTYLRGDLNALDYRRLRRFSGTHRYFAEWIAFRRSPAGRHLRQWSRPGEGFFRAFIGPALAALALVYNADDSEGGQKLLFAINPTGEDTEVAIAPEVADLDWRLVADHDRFYAPGEAPAGRVERQLFVPALGCALWSCGE
ncbi:MAG: glycoside hydrolase family 1 [Opitutus sp.]|nr:glycoside hydrolase family 1 [Opitutus sp.]